MDRYNNGKLGQWNYGEDLELSDDFTKPLPKNAYERAKEIARGVGRGSIEALSDKATITKIINSTLPPGYASGYRVATDLYEAGEDLYDDISKELRTIEDDL